MLKEQEKNNSNAIEKYVVNKMREAIKEPLPPHLAKVLLRLLQNESPYPVQEIPDDRTPPLYNYIERRHEDSFRYNLPDKRLVMFLACISRSPGSALMYLWYLQWWSKANNFKEITLPIFTMQIFPDGFPSWENILTIYDGQQLPSGKNLIDYSTAGKSILTY